MGLLSTFSLFLLIGAVVGGFLYIGATDTHRFTFHFSDLELGETAKDRCFKAFEEELARLKENHTVIDRMVQFGPCAHGDLCTCDIEIKTV